MCYGNESFDDVTVDCGVGAMVVSVPVCALTNNHLKSETLRVIQKGLDCEAVTSGSNIVFNLPLSSEACGTSLVQNDTHLVYSNAIYAAGGKKSEVITRQSSIDLLFSCAMASGR